MSIDGSVEEDVKAKKPAKELSVHEKAILIAQASRGHATNSKLAKQFGVSSATVSRILKRKAEYLVLAKANNGSSSAREDGPSRKRKFRSDSHALLNSLVYKWYSASAARDVHVSGPMLREKARRLAVELDIPDFKASNGWIDNFRQRYRIASFQAQASIGTLLEKSKAPTAEILSHELPKELDDVTSHDASFTHFMPPTTPTPAPAAPTAQDHAALVQRVAELEAQVQAMQAWQESFQRAVAQQREDDVAQQAAKAVAHDAQLASVLDLLKHSSTLELHDTSIE
ncbi:transcriptional regulator ATRX-like [Achlya hypogyna]|uniref:Transcriptional regulator ATRX-like n=1 Tax=Achlya hypogyna TaxID=1202772 RepID=A0A1V9YZ60_ACHHY|nr:transcriptional regulator ATRX-like [Achlya hypogyna]